MPDAPYVLDDVRVVRETDLGWSCEIQSRTIFVGRLQIVGGTTVPRVGERGRIALTASAARDLGVLDLATAVAGAGKPPADAASDARRRR